MLNLLHNFQPEPIIFQLGPIVLRWYGLFIVLGIGAALILSLWLAKKYYQIGQEAVLDLTLYLVLGGLVGARLYEVLLFLPYYLDNPGQILQIWRGGLAIHGAIIAGLIVIYYFSRLRKIDFFKLTALAVPGLALGQAIGRWGNYFNQELFGLPTNLPWGIPISLINRPLAYLDAQYFHPTFLYESLACLALFFILLFLNVKLLKKESGSKHEVHYVWLTAVYVISYSVIRFMTEFVRLDETPIMFGLRWPQMLSLILIVISLLFLLLITKHHVRKKEKK